MKFTETELPDVFLIEPELISDDTGSLNEIVDLNLSGNSRCITSFVQDNTSLSTQRHTLRGMHYQRPPHAQAKLVRCVQGALMDVVVDIRLGSPHFGRSHSVELSARNRIRLFVPRGFLHGFLTLTDNTVIEYKCSDNYEPAYDGAVRWDSLGIDWGVSDPILSIKDTSATPFAEFDTPFIYGSP